MANYLMRNMNPSSGRNANCKNLLSSCFASLIFASHPPLVVVVLLVLLVVLVVGSTSHKFFGLHSFLFTGGQASFGKLN